MSSDSLAMVLEQTRAQAEFEAVLLTDFGRRILAAARADDTPPETIGALLDLSMRFAATPEERSRLGDTGESTFFDWEGRHVIFRWFPGGVSPSGSGQRCLLVILAPNGTAYKRAAGQLIRQVQRTLGS